VVAVANAAEKDRGTLDRSLRELASKVEGAKTARAGDVIFRLSGKTAGTYRLSIRPGKSEVTETTDVTGQPLVEVIGDAEAIQAVIDGKADARKQFLSGGIRVRGDLQLLSDVALELGLIKDPL
jgi:hypothetical protein